MGKEQPAKAAGPELSKHGAMPRWEVAVLEAPPTFNARNMLRVIGPGAVLAATSGGGGEWLVGPAVAVRLFTFLANIAGVVLVIAGIQILIVNRSFLPQSFRPPLWREIALLACSLSYAFFTFFVIRSIIAAL